MTLAYSTVIPLCYVSMVYTPPIADKTQIRIWFPYTWCYSCVAQFTSYISCSSIVCVSSDTGRAYNMLHQTKRNYSDSLASLTVPPEKNKKKWRTNSYTTRHRSHHNSTYRVTGKWPSQNANLKSVCHPMFTSGIYVHLIYLCLK